ncbi:MAG: hypothetical protein KF691_15605 [Phycisphaeraceae bacterium]|nr:hypothetical protein [Phycisphaeraceae bacterium]
MPEEVPTTTNDQPFYVGYLPVPAPLRTFFKVIAPLLVAGVIAVGLVAARTQRDPGPARWNDGVAQQFRGFIVRTPYPALLVQSESSGGPPSVFLLVEMGKHGAARELPPDGSAVNISGWKLDRDGRQMIELEPGSDALKPESATKSINLARPTRLGTVTITGEIVDSKCYLGAMKPGEGKTHKACATLCIRGGVPPVLVTRDAQTRFEHVLLCSDTGDPLGPEFWPFVADPVSVTGELEILAGIKRLRVPSGGVRPL